MLMNTAEHSQADDTGSASQIFAAPPISPMNEIGAYEHLWLGEGTWFKNLAELFETNPGAVPSELVPRESAADALRRLTDLIGPEKLRKLGVRVHGAGEYPLKLRDAAHPIELLYYLGDWDLAETQSVAVVGTRHPSEEGKRNAARVARALVRAGYTVTSGLAKGIDKEALTAAIEAGGKTVGVIGTPIYTYYPKENAKLQDLIASEHLLISQVPFLRYAQQHYKANSLFFPARNVTMSALTKATVIIEAGNTSGTLVQARAALAQGRQLFILDSCFRDKSLTWPSKFLERGAIRVSTPSEIIAALQDGSAS